MGNSRGLKRLRALSLCNDGIIRNKEAHTETSILKSCECLDEGMPQGRIEILQGYRETLRAFLLQFINENFI